MTNPEHPLPCSACRGSGQVRTVYGTAEHSKWRTCARCLGTGNELRAAAPAAADANTKPDFLHEQVGVKKDSHELNTPAAADEVERVARAMYFVGHSYGWENEADSVRWEYLELARAAIAAMNRTAAAATEDMPRGEYEAHVAQYAKANRELRLRAEKSESDVAVERAFHRKLVDERDSWFALFDEVSRHLGCNARCLVDGNPHVIERARYLSSMFTGDRYVATERAERERDAAMKRAEVAEALMGTEVDRNTLKLMSISADASYKMAVLERDDARDEVRRLRAQLAMIPKNPG